MNNSSVTTSTLRKFGSFGNLPVIATAAVSGNARVADPIMTPYASHPNHSEAFLPNTPAKVATETDITKAVR